MHDDDLFSAAMGKVKPIKDNNKISLEKPKPKIFRPESTQRSTPAINFSDHAAPASRCVQHRDDPWLLMADGISRDTIKRLAAGQPAIGLSFDLHGMSRDASLSLLHDGVQQAMHEHIRALCIVHGRGLHSQDNKPILKHAVYHWLRQGSLAHLILAVIPQPGSGGGACLVLLRRQKL